ncbi:MAG: hypothetical protein ABJB86_20330 [Bacteroidota bacterium]
MKKIFLSVILVTLLSFIASAQVKTSTISGKITSFEESLPL